MSTALLIFQISIRSPTKQLMITTVLVSLSITYKRTMTDWKTLKNTDRTERPSNVLRLRQNWMSEKVQQSQRSKLSKSVKFDCSLESCHLGDGATSEPYSRLVASTFLSSRLYFKIESRIGFKERNFTSRFFSIHTKIKLPQQNQNIKLL